MRRRLQPYEKEAYVHLDTRSSTDAVVGGSDGPLASSETSRVTTDTMVGRLSGEYSKQSLHL